MGDFTPGPWRVERDGDVIDEHKLVDWPYLITAADGTKVCNLVECETSEEDARLLAAAPDLLALVRDHLQDHLEACHLTRRGDNCPLVSDTRAVIARIEGLGQ